MHLGLSSYTFVWSVGVPGYPQPPAPLTAEGLLRKAAEFGVTVVQIADNLPPTAKALNSLLAPTTSSASASKLSAASIPITRTYR
jgi:hypothetical protein